MSSTMGAAIGFIRSKADDRLPQNRREADASGAHSHELRPPPHSGNLKVCLPAGLRSGVER